MVDFGAPLTHTEILLPLGGKHILSPKPPDGISEIIEFPRREVSDSRELSSFLVYACSIFPEMWFFEDEKPPSDG